MVWRSLLWFFPFSVASPIPSFAQEAFEKSVYALARKADRCLSCHQAMSGREFASNDLALAYDVAKRFVDPVSPEKSALVLRAGNGHCGLDFCRGETKKAEMLEAVKYWIDNDRTSKPQDPFASPYSMKHSVSTIVSGSELDFVLILDSKFTLRVKLSLLGGEVLFLKSAQLETIENSNVSPVRFQGLDLFVGIKGKDKQQGRWRFNLDYQVLAIAQKNKLTLAGPMKNAASISFDAAIPDRTEMELEARFDVSRLKESEIEIRGDEAIFPNIVKLGLMGLEPDLKTKRDWEEFLHCFVNRRGKSLDLSAFFRRVETRAKKMGWESKGSDFLDDQYQMTKAYESREVHELDRERPPSFAISAGGSHTCVILESSEAMCFGNGTSGRLGYGNTDNRLSPREAIDFREIRAKQISAGNAHTCAILGTGEAVCFGQNSFAQLGNGTKSDRNAPEEFFKILDRGAQQISAGHRHTCVVTSAGEVSCFGFNLFGQLGYGDNINRVFPDRFINFQDQPVKQISTGIDHTCALLASGQVKCFGRNQFGQLGTGDLLSRTSPLDIVDFGGKSVRQISAGFLHTCAVLESGEASCFGWGSSGQLGTGAKDNKLSPGNPINFDGKLVRQISAAVNHSCALTESGEVFCFGSNTAGQLGILTEPAGKPIPTKPVDFGGKRAVQLATGSQFTCVVLEDGQAACFGNGSSGQLGYGNQMNRPLPDGFIDFGGFKVRR